MFIEPNTAPCQAAFKNLNDFSDFYHLQSLCAASVEQALSDLARKCLLALFIGQMECVQLVAQFQTGLAMRRRLLILALLIIPFAVHADDSDSNPIAASIKWSVNKSIYYHYNGVVGFCDVMITMDHVGDYAIIKRVSSTGTHEYCNFIKKQIRKGQKYKYEFPEKLIQLSF
ncbi:hypothetical protein NTE23_002869 [Vibrio mimicus]